MRNLGAVAIRSRGGIGRRVRLRTVWGNPWRFESSREHHLPNFAELQARGFARNRQLLRSAAERTVTPDQPPAFLLAAQRAFISWESRRRPAAVRPPFFLARPARAVPFPPFCLAQRALAAAASLARVAADTLRCPAGRELPRLAERDVPPPIKEAKRFSRESICRRSETACSKFLRDKSMGCHIAGVGRYGNELFKPPK